MLAAKSQPDREEIRGFYVALQPRRRVTTAVAIKLVAVLVVARFGFGLTDLTLAVLAALTTPS